MPDVFDLLSLARVDTATFKAILADERKVAEFGLTSAQLEAIKKMDPNHLRLIVDAIEERLRVGPVAGTNACPGTFACIGGRPAERIPR